MSDKIQFLALQVNCIAIQKLYFIFYFSDCATSSEFPALLYRWAFEIA